MSFFSSDAPGSPYARAYISPFGVTAPTAPRGRAGKEKFLEPDLDAEFRALKRKTDVKLTEFLTGLDSLDVTYYRHVAFEWPPATASMVGFLCVCLSAFAVVICSSIPSSRLSFPLTLIFLSDIARHRTF